MKCMKRKKIDKERKKRSKGNEQVRKKQEKNIKGINEEKSKPLKEKSVCVIKVSVY